MRRLSVFAALVLLVGAAVPLVSANQEDGPHHLSGNVQAAFQGAPGITAMIQFEVQTGPTGKLQDGYYRYEGMTPAVDRSQATVDAIRFFTDKTGARAADFTGTECSLLSTPGSCHWYHIVVTDGSSRGLSDTFCGGTDKANPTDCPFRFDVLDGSIRIY
jgi:hypothetical protein